jgi:hypothetical protein
VDNFERPAWEARAEAEFNLSLKEFELVDDLEPE